MPLPDALQDRLGDARPGEDHDLRRPGDGGGRSREEGRQVADGNPPSPKTHTLPKRDPAERERRKRERAEARIDLRQRYAQYKRFVHKGDAGHAETAKQLRAEHTRALAALRKEVGEAKIKVRQEQIDPSDKLIAIVAIDARAARRRLNIDKQHADRLNAHRATRQPPLGWRQWLHEQSNLGDQAAISALRGIAYQARRDARKSELAEEDLFDEARAARDEAYREAQHKKLVARLLEEEKQEIAIRAARRNAMRAYEVDALLVRYAGMQWRVTGNGNIEYSDRGGDHLFTDRGNRITFDREHVTDDKIHLALAHAQNKFGRAITLTGDDPVFTARMARLADDMGLTVLNPEMQPIIEAHRQHKRKPAATPAPQPSPAARETAPRGEAQKTTPPPAPVAPARQPEPAQPERTETPVPPAPAPEQPLEARLRAQILSIDPQATFTVADPADDKALHIGSLAAVQPDGFVQHGGRNRYTLHLTPPPAGLAATPDTIREIRYRNRRLVVRLVEQTKGKGRTD